MAKDISDYNFNYYKPTLEEVRALREKIGAGMTDCKRALEAAKGDEEGAIEVLRHTPFCIVCGRMPEDDTCEYCDLEECIGTYDEKAVKCQECTVRKCLLKDIGRIK